MLGHLPPFHPYQLQDHRSSGLSGSSVKFSGHEERKKLEMCYIKRQLKFFIKGKVLFKIFGGASCKLKNIRGVLHNFGRHKALWNSSNMSSQIQPIKKTQKIHLGSITMDDTQLDRRQTCCRANIIICEIYICKFHFQFTYVRSLASCHHGIRCNNKYNCCS